MSREVEDRVVKMQFDNSNFEKNVSKSLGTLDKLKSALNFGSTADSVKQLESMNSISFDGLSSSLGIVADRFNAMGIVGMRVIQNLTDSAYNMASNLLKSFTITPVTSGWQKYEEMLQSQQKIMTAVQGKVSQVTGELYNMDTVSERISKIKWYSDETSYSIDQMTSAIGDFTASGVDLDIATKAIMGFANASAEAGVPIDRAGSAFTAFSRAIGSGGLTLSLWNNQLKTSGITASEKFRQSLIDAAIAEGTLVKVGNKLFTKNKKFQVEAASLESTLTEGGWATKEVLLRLANGYADTVDTLYKLTDDGTIDMTSESMKTLTAEMEKQGLTLHDLKLDKQYDQASEAISALKDAYKKLGLEVPKSLSAFSNAQEAVTLTQALDAIKVAVTSGWEDTYEILFGNYEKAKKLWTDLSNTLYDIFVSIGNSRNEILEEWNNWNGIEGWSADQVIQGFKNIFNSITAIIDAVKEAFHSFFPEKDVSEWALSLRNLTNGFYNLTGSILDFLVPGEKILEQGEFYERRMGKNTEVLEKLQTLLSPFFNLLKLGSEIVSKLLKSLEPLGPIIFETLGWLVDTIALPVANWLNDVITKARESQFLAKVFEVIRNTLENLGAAIAVVREKLSIFIDFISEKFGAGFSKATEAFSGFSINWESIKTVIDSIIGVIAKLWNAVQPILGKAGEILGNFFGVLKTGIENWDFTDVYKYLEPILNLVKAILGFKIAMNFNWITEGLSSWADALWGISRKMTASAVLDVAKAILVLAGAMLIMSLIPADKTVQVSAMLVMTALLMKEMLTYFAFISKAIDRWGMMSIAAAIGSITAAILVIGIAAKIISTIPAEQMLYTMLSIAALVGEMIVVVYMVNGLNNVPKMGGLIAFALSLFVLTLSIKSLGKMDQKSLMQGLLAVASMILVMGMMMSMVNEVKVPRMGGMIAIALSLLLLIPVVKQFGEMDADIVTQGSVVAAGLMIFMGLLLKMIGTANGFNTLAGSVAILGIAASMIVLSKAITTLGELDFEKLGNGLLGFFVILASITAALLLLSTNSVGVLAASVSLLIVSGALVIFTAALAALGALPIKILVSGLIVLAVALIGFGMAAAVLTPVIGTLIALALALTMFGVSILTLSAGLAVFIVTMVIWAQSWSMIVDSIKALFISVLDTIIETSPKIGQAVLSVISSVLQVFIDSQEMIGAKVAQIIITTLNQIATWLPQITTALVKMVITLIYSLADALTTYAPILNSAITNVVLSLAVLVLDLIGGFLGELPYIGGKLKGGVDKIINNIKEDMDANKAKQVGEEFAHGIGGGFEEGVAKEATRLQSNASIMKNSVFEGLEDIEGAASESASTAIDSYTSALSEKAPEVSPYLASISDPMQLVDIEGFAMSADTNIDSYIGEYDINAYQFTKAGEDSILDTSEGMTGNVALTSLQQSTGVDIKTIVDKMGEYDWPSVGTSITSGMADGLVSIPAIEQLVASATTIADTVKDTVNTKMDSHSPSREMFKIGTFAVQGLINGIKDMFSSVGKIGSSLGDIVLDSVSDGVLSITDIVMEDIGDPVIRPVLDLSKVTSEARKLDGILSANPFIGANRFSSVQFNQNGGNSPSGGMTFIQNNYSPKELSRSEIYRQTKNQFSAAKGLMDGI